VQVDPGGIGHVRSTGRFDGAQHLAEQLRRVAPLDHRRKRPHHPLRARCDRLDDDLVPALEVPDTPPPWTGPNRR